MSKHRLIILGVMAFLLLTGIQPSILAAETEPNNALGQSTTIGINAQTTGTFNPTGDSDWYKITLTTPGRMKFSITNPPSTLRPRIDLFNRHADYIWVANAAVNEGDDVHLTHDYTEPGTYFIRLTDADNDASSSAYTFSTSFTPVSDAQEPNNEIGDAFLIPTATVTGYIFNASDSDFFKIWVNSGNKLSLTLKSPSAMRGSIDMYNSHMEYLYISSTAVNPGDTVYLDYTAPESDYYILRISDVRSLSHTNAYTLTLSGGNPGYVPPQNPVTTETETNNKAGYANLISLNTEIDGIIQIEGDRDWYRLNVPNAGQMTIDVTQIPNDIQLRVTLYDRSLRHIISAESSDPGRLYSMVWDIASAGEFYILAEALHNIMSSNPYTFSTSLIPVIDASEPNDNYGDATAISQLNRTEGYIFPAGDQDWFRIQVETPGDVEMILSQVPKSIQPEIQFYNTSKQYLAGKTGIAGEDLSLVYTVLNADTYLVRVTDSGLNNVSTAPYTLTIIGGKFTSYAPIASIDLINPGSLVVGESIQLTGSGKDQDGSIQGYNWRSNIDGNLSTQAAFTTQALSVGTHTIYFKVQDNSGIWSTEKTEIIYVGTGVSTESESNAPIGNANEIALDSPVKAKIDQQWDEDFFKAYIDRPGRLTLAATNVPPSLRLSINVFNNNLDYLWIGQTGAMDGDNVSLDMNITEIGWYYFRVTDADGNFDADLTYSIKAALIPVVDLYETNNRMLDAHTLTENSLDAYLFPNGDSDWYRVWVNAGSTVQADLTNVPSNLRLWIGFYDRNRNYTYVAKQAENEGDPVQLSRTFDTAGFIYIQVNERDNDYNWTQTYRLTLTGANPGYVQSETPLTVETEINNDIADANRIGFDVPVSATIGESNDTDWFKITMGTPGIIHARLNPVPSDLRMRLRIYMDDKSHINYAEATNSGDTLSLDTRITQPGTYFVVAEGAAGFNPNNAYQLTVSTTPAYDTYEPNNIFGNAVVLKDHNTVQAMIFDRGDEDWYRVSADAGSTLTVTVGDVPASIRPQIEIYNRHRNYLASKLASNDGQELTMAYPVTATDDYWIRIGDVGWDSYAAKPYTLVITGAHFSSFAPLAAIDSVSPNPVLANEAVTLEGHGDDSDGSIIGYAWRSSLDGAISNSQIATLDSLSTGVHTIYFKVKDNDQSWSTEVSTILYFGVSAPGEEEPNNEIGEANPVEMDTPFTGTIDPGNDVDFYRIHVSQPGRLIIDASNPTGSLMRIGLDMYTLDADYSWHGVNASNPGDPVTFQWDLNDTGYYFMRIRDNDSKAGSKYTVTVTLKAAEDPYEPNNDFTQATPLSLQDNVSGYIFPSSDQDWYEVTTDKPGILTISLNDMPSDIRGRIDMYNQNTDYTWIAAAANNDGDNVTLNYIITSAGTHFIRITDADNQTNPEASYRLTTSFKPAPDAFEPNNEFRNATLIQTSSVNAYIFANGDIDMYKFYAETGATLTMTADNVPSNLRLNFDLFNVNNDYLYVNKSTDVEGGSVVLNYTVTQTGYYYLRVTDRDSDYSAEAPYRLTVTGAILNVAPGIVQTAENEPNNEFGYATLVGISAAPITGKFETNDSDWFTFDVAEPGKLTVSLNVPSNIRSEIRLYDANKTERASRIAENNGDASAFTFDIPESGTWYVKIDSKDGVTSTENYSLSLILDPVADSFESNDSYSEARPLNFGETIQPNIFPVGDNDWFQIETEQPGLIRVSIESVPQNIKMGLIFYNENSAILLNKQILNAGDPLEDVWLAGSPGRFFLRVYDRQNNAAAVEPYSLTVFFTPMEDGTEPNNRFAHATVLEDSNQVQGLIYPVGDHDWYRIYVSDPGNLRIQIAQTGGFNPQIQLFTDSKQYITSKYAKHNGDDMILTFAITKADFYYIWLNDQGDNSRSSEPYLMTIEGADFQTYHPIAAIDDFSPNPAITGSAVTLRGSGTDQDGTIAAYEWIADTNVIGRQSSFITSNLNPGTHRIGFRVQDNEGNSSATVYRNLIVTDSVIEEAEFNPTIETASLIPVGQWIIGKINPQSDEDFYKFYIERPGLLSINVDAVPNAMKARIDLYDQDGAFLWLGDAAINPADRIEYQLFRNSGWMYVRVRDDLNQRYDRTYAMKIELTPAPDRYEPNDSMSSSTPLALNTILDDPFICRENDPDFYRVQITQKGRLSLSLTEMPPTMKGKIDIYNPHQDYLFIGNGANYGGDDVYLDMDIDSLGVYYIRITDSDGRAHTLPYRFENRFTPVNDAYEENDSLGTAKLIPANGIVDAVIFPLGDMDCFKLYATKGQTLSLSIANVPAEMKAAINIFNRDLDYTYRSESSNNLGDTIYLNYEVPADGFSYIRIFDETGKSHVQPYRLTVTGGTPNYEPQPTPVITEIEPNGNYGEAVYIELNTGVSGAIDPATEEDWYRFYINSPGIVTISHTNIPGTITSEMWVRNSDRTQIGYRTTTNAGEDNILILPIMSAGNYWVTLADNGRNNASTSPYTLRVTHTPVVDPNEPNDNFGFATQVGQDTVQGYIFDQNDEDWYRVYVRNPGTMDISVNTMPAEIRPHIRLYNANKGPLKEWLATNDGQTGENLVSQAVETPGYYYLQFNDEGKNSYSSSSYSLTIAGADFSLAPLLDAIGNRTISEEILYTFTVNATDPDNPQDLTYSATGLPPGSQFDAETRTFSWTPSNAQSGDYSGIQFKVSDGTYSDSEAITITVQNMNHAPTLSPIGNRMAALNTELVIPLSATDPDSGDTITYIGKNLPDTAILDSHTGVFRWTPTASGVYNDLYFEATDGNRSDFEFIQITVTETLIGDIDGDQTVGLADVITGLMMLTGIDVPSVNLDADVNGDGKIGLAEVGIVMQIVAGIK